jgi:hypothetical protein
LGLVLVNQTDGQVLVVQDMLGLTFGRVARFVRNFMKEQSGETRLWMRLKLIMQLCKINLSQQRTYFPS